MAFCLWHAIEYQGGICPRCWQEKQQERLTDKLERIKEEENRQREEWEEERAQREEEIADRIVASNLEAKIEMDMRLRAAAEEQQQNIAQAPMLQARAKSERAYELYQVGLYEDALQTALEAIKLDRGNMKATQIASWALAKQGRAPEAAEYFTKQLALLKTPDYINSSAWFSSVLLGLPNNQEFLQTFSETLRKSSNRWNRPSDCFGLIDALMDRKLMDDAKVLTESLIKKDDSLMLQAYLLEISGRTGKPLSERVSAFLRAIPFNNREHVLDSFQTILVRKNRFSDTTLSQIKGAICERYNGWKTQIENDISQTAIGGTKSAGSGTGWGCGFAAVCFVVLLVIANALHSTPIQHLWLVTDGMNVFAPVSVFASLLSGLWGGRIIRRLRSAGYARQRIEAAVQKENQKWHSICPTTVSPQTLGLHSIFFELFLLLVASGVILIGLFSYLSSAQEQAIRALTFQGNGQGVGTNQQTLADKTPSTTRQLDVTGIWIGEFNNVPATLVINNQRKNAFSGTLRVQTSHIVIKGYVAETRQISLEETRVLEESSGQWSLGKDNGSVSVDGESMQGTGADTVGNQYSWSFSRLSSDKKAPETKDAMATIGGTYYLYRLEDPASGPVRQISITVRKTDFLIYGDDGMEGRGKIDGAHGYYDWRISDGQSGRTRLTINSDGTLKGHVLGPGLDWWYIARRP